MPLFVPDIPLSDFDAQNKVRDRLAQIAPAADLGILAPLAVRLAAITGQTTLTFPRKTVVLVAADHGHPFAQSDLTSARTVRIARGRDPVNALARQAGAPLLVADVGLKSGLQLEGLTSVSVAPGSKNPLVGPVLGLPQVNDAVMVGMNLASIEISKGLDVLVVGAISPGARWPSLACLHILTGKPLPELTADEEEQTSIVAALEINQPQRLDPLDLLRTVGGLDIATLVGLILTAAAGRKPVVLDGLPAAVAALLASYLAPAVRAYWVAGHRTGDPVHDIALRSLGARSLIDLGIAQAPGCGGVLALHIIEAAARLVNESEPQEIGN